ncbi:MAG: SH3 domain-containing protein [Alphaproteobacteria bacterium]|nr:SH3 domain-containing protein [Alphaproteobacteria bacterium]
MKVIAVLFSFMLIFCPALVCAENDNIDNIKNSTGLPLPRFASLHTGEVNARTGPGTRYPIEWVFKRQGLPVEITAEYELWRRIRDSEGAEGWVHKTAVSGKRLAMVSGKTRDMRKSDNAQAPVVAHLEVGALGQLLSCSKDWCRIKFDGIKGYLPKDEFWGAYKEEVFD